MKKLRTVRSKSAVAGFVLVLAAAVSSRAAVIHVPADYPTIQAAVDAAASGDEIRIAAGVYTNQVVVVNKSSLTLSGSPGAVLRAIPDMQRSLLPAAGPNALGVPLLAIFKSDVVVSGLTFEGERLADSQPDNLLGISFVAAGGRVEDCQFTGFRGRALGAATNSWGFGVHASNPRGYGFGAVDIKVLRSTFADNVVSIQLIGDLEPPGTPWHPELLRTAFAVNDNTIVGSGPDATGQQLGIWIWAGAGGEVKRNTITDFAYVGPAIWAPFSYGILANDEVDAGNAPLEALQTVRYEGNIFRNNQIDLMFFRGNGSTVVNNTFEGAGPGHRPTGLGFSGDNVLVGTNRFSDLETGILLFGDDPEYGTNLCTASNATLVGNGFCNVVTNLTVEPLATYTEQGTLPCPGLPKLDIRAIQLSWPYSSTGYSVETAPAPGGPWTPSDARPSPQDGQNRVVIPAESDQRFFRLAKPSSR